MLGVYPFGTHRCLLSQIILQLIISSRHILVQLTVRGERVSHGASWVTLYLSLAGVGSSASLSTLKPAFDSNV